MNINSLTIPKRLWLSTCISGIILSLIGFLGLWNINKLIQSLETITDSNMPALRYATLVDMEHDGIRSSILDIILKAKEGGENLSEAISSLDEHIKNINEYFAVVDKLELNSSIEKATEGAKEPIEKYTTIAKTLAEKIKSKTDSSLEFKAFMDQFEFLEEKLAKLGDFIAAEAKESSEDSKNIAHIAFKMILIILFMGLCLGIFFSFVINQSLIKQLNAIMAGLTEQSKYVKDVSDKMNVSAKSLSNESLKQASAVQETAASLDEIHAMVGRTAESCVQLSQSLDSNTDNVNRGNRSVADMASAMGAIKMNNEKILEGMNENIIDLNNISSVISEIGAKTQVINEIVFQTKLLSFNASVEAARAGEHGKGFAVVAEEVGNLASMSGKAAKEISELMSRGIQTIERIVTQNQSKTSKLISSAQEQMVIGEKTTKECSASFQMIVEQNSEVRVVSSEISSASKEQVIGIKEIKEAIGQIDQSTHENSENAKNSIEIAEKLIEQLNDLDQVVSDLHKLVVGGELS